MQRFPIALALVVTALLSELAPAPGRAATSASAQGPTPLVIGETLTLSSAVLAEERVVNIYRPPGVPEDAKLPLLVMPDGGIGEDFLHVAGLLQISVMNGTARPFLLVGIENTERRRDLTGPTRNEQDRDIAPRVGGSATFRRFLREELLPEIESRYPTTGERAIVGESLAGLFVLETLALAPDLFDTYLAFDPSLWWNDESLVATADEWVSGEPGADKTVVLASSEQPEIAAATARLDEALARSAPEGFVRHHWPMPEETHATIYHPAALRAFREVLAPGTIFVDGERKTTLATLLVAEAGDRACSLELLDREGEPFTELASFEICEQPDLLGKKVELTYARANVLAASCGGDPDCGRSDSVVLVEEAETLRPWVPSLCTSEETVVFSCGVAGQQVVSVCGSPDLDASTGSLQFRMGPFGQEPQARYPPGSTTHPSRVFLGGTLAFSGGGGASLQFEVDDTIHAVFTGIGKGWEKEGFIVRAADGEVLRELPCRTDWVSELGPVFFESVGIPSDPDGFEIP